LREEQGEKPENDDYKDGLNADSFWWERNSKKYSEERP
jgi:hypothetical protein